MACQKCDFKGYIESFIAINAGFKSQIKQCFDCNDIEAYSKKVMNGEEVKTQAVKKVSEMGKVYLFRRNNE